MVIIILITIATDDLQLGYNDTINEEQQIQQYQFESPQNDFELEHVEADPALQLQPINEAMQLQQEESINKEAMQLQQEEPMNKEAMQLQQEEPMNKEAMQLQQEEQRTNNKEELTHEENKLLLTLSGVIFGYIIMWTLR